MYTYEYYTYNECANMMCVLILYVCVCVHAFVCNVCVHVLNMETWYKHTYIHTHTYKHTYIHTHNTYLHTYIHAYI
jgi:hypothetical protein